MYSKENKEKCEQEINMLIQEKTRIINLYEQRLKEARVKNASYENYARRGYVNENNPERFAWLELENLQKTYDGQIYDITKKIKAKQEELKDFDPNVRMQKQQLKEAKEKRQEAYKKASIDVHAILSKYSGLFTFESGLLISLNKEDKLSLRSTYTRSDNLVEMLSSWHDLIAVGSGYVGYYGSAINIILGVKKNGSVYVFNDHYKSEILRFPNISSLPEKYFVVIEKMVDWTKGEIYPDDEKDIVKYLSSHDGSHLVLNLNRSLINMSNNKLSILESSENIVCVEYGGPGSYSRPVTYALKQNGEILKIVNNGWSFHIEEKIDNQGVNLNRTPFSDMLSKIKYAESDEANEIRKKYCKKCGSKFKGIVFKKCRWNCK